MSQNWEILQGEARAAAWNRLVPTGTPCLFVTDLGETIETETRSEAWCLGHGTPVVKIKGKSGGVALERVFPNEMVNSEETIDEMIERAARELPQGASVTIEVENGYGSVMVHYANGDSENDVWDYDTMRDKVFAAIGDAMNPDGPNTTKQN